MKYKNNELNFCDYCEVTKENTKEKLTNDKCCVCNKFYCSSDLPDEYQHNGSIPSEVRPDNICKHCYIIITHAHCKSSGFNGKEAWGEYSIFDQHLSGNGSSIHLGNIMAFIYRKHSEEAKKEVLKTIKELYKKSNKFLAKKD